MPDSPVARLSDAARQAVPLFFVEDMQATLEWYRTVGFSTRDEFDVETR